MSQVNNIDTEFPFNRNGAIISEPMEQDFLSEVTHSHYAMHSRALHREDVQHPLSYSPSLQNTCQRRSIDLAKRVLRSAAQRYSVARIRCPPSEGYRLARAERALRYAVRRCSDAQVKSSMCYISEQGGRPPVLLIECSLHYTPRPLVTTLVESLIHIHPGYYSIVNAPKFNSYQRILMRHQYPQAFLYWAIRSGIIILLTGNNHALGRAKTLAFYYNLYAVLMKSTISKLSIKGC